MLKTQLRWGHQRKNVLFQKDEASHLDAFKAAWKDQFINSRPGPAKLKKRGQSLQNQNPAKQKRQAPHP